MHSCCCARRMHSWAGCLVPILLGLRCVTDWNAMGRASLPTCNIRVSDTRLAAGVLTQEHSQLWTTVG